MKKHIVLATAGTLVALGALGYSVHHYEEQPKPQTAPVVPLSAYTETVNSMKAQLAQAQQSTADWQASASKALAQRQALCAFNAKYHIHGYDPALCK